MKNDEKYVIHRKYSEILLSNLFKCNETETVCCLVYDNTFNPLSFNRFGAVSREQENNLFLCFCTLVGW